MRPFRATFAGDVVAELLPPRRASRKVALLCDGLPTVPCKREVMDFLSRRNFWAVHVRYRGTWESGGTFLARPPHEDALDVLRGLSKGFIDVWTGERRAFGPTKAYVFGSSFGGTAAILASLDPAVTKAIALAPVIDWTKEGRYGTERPEALYRVIREGYGGAYRFSRTRWRHLLAGGFYDPWTERGRIDGGKLLLIHAADDDVTPYRLTRKFAEATGSAFVPRKRGGHLSLSGIMRPMNWRRIERFIAT